MSTLNVTPPNSLHAHLQDMAEREGISVEQFVATAVAEKMAALMTESYLSERAPRGSRAKYEAVLVSAGGMSNPKTLIGFHPHRVAGVMI